MLCILNNIFLISLFSSPNPQQDIQCRNGSFLELKSLLRQFNLEQVVTPSVSPPLLFPGLFDVLAQLKPSHIAKNSCPYLLQPPPIRTCTRYWSLQIRPVLVPIFPVRLSWFVALRELSIARLDVEPGEESMQKLCQDNRVLPFLVCHHIQQQHTQTRSRSRRPLSGNFLARVSITKISRAPPGQTWTTCSIQSDSS